MPTRLITIIFSLKIIVFICCCTSANFKSTFLIPAMPALENVGVTDNPLTADWNIYGGARASLKAAAGLTVLGLSSGGGGWVGIPTGPQLLLPAAYCFFIQTPTSAVVDSIALLPACGITTYRAIAK